jgi:hypothetical protein
LGQSVQIFFPKLREEQMKTFSSIGEDFLREFGSYEPEYCKTEKEAREKTLSLSIDADKYPVYFFPTDTSGEKKYEEFFVPGEDVDMKTFEQLGVIRNAASKPMAEIEKLFEVLNNVFVSNQVTKQAIVNAIGDFIPNFKHIETGKSLDQKM